MTGVLCFRYGQTLINQLGLQAEYLVGLATAMDDLASEALERLINNTTQTSTKIKHSVKKVCEEGLFRQNQVRIPVFKINLVSLLLRRRIQL